MNVKLLNRLKECTNKAFDLLNWNKNTYDKFDSDMAEKWEVILKSLDELGDFIEKKIIK